MATDHDGIGEPEHGQNGNGTGASLARLSERSYSHAATLGSHGDRIEALETYIIEQQSIWKRLPDLISIATLAGAIFLFGIAPLKDKNDDQDSAIKEAETRATETLRREVDQQHETLKAQMALIDQKADFIDGEVKSVIRFLERQTDRERE